MTVAVAMLATAAPCKQCVHKWMHLKRKLQHSRVRCYLHRNGETLNSAWSWPHKALPFMRIFHTKPKWNHILLLHISHYKLLLLLLLLGSVSVVGIRIYSTCGVTTVAFSALHGTRSAAAHVVVAVIERKHRIRSRSYSLFVRRAARSHGNVSARAKALKFLWTLHDCTRSCAPSTAHQPAPCRVHHSSALQT